VKKNKLKIILPVITALILSLLLTGCPKPDYDRVHLDPDWTLISQVPATFINPDWEVHTSSRQIKSITFYNGRYYLGTEGGILIVEMSGGEAKIVEKLTSEHGLSSNYITCSATDMNNNLWFGTKNMGVIKINDIEIICYRNMKNPNANFVTDITCDRNGDIWFTSLGAGLFKIQNERFYRFTAPGDFKVNSFTRIAVTDSGEIYLATINSGNYKFDIVHGFTRFSDEIVNDLEIDNFGNLWMATTSGLILIERSGERKIFNSTHGLNSDYISSLFFSGSNLYIGTMGRGINVYEQNRFKTRTNSKAYQDNISCLYFNDGMLFAGTENGLVTYQGDFKHGRVKPENEPGGNIIMSMDFDGETLWVGTFYSGAGYFSNSNWSWLRYPNDLPSNEVNAVKKIKNNIFIGTSSGLLIISRNSKHLLNRENGLPGSHVTALDYDPENDVILVGTNRGLGMMEKGGWRRFNIYSGLHNDSIMSVSVVEGKYWVGTIGGAELYRNGRFIKYDVSNSRLENNQISDITLFNDEIIFGTFGGGITLKKGDSWRNLSIRDGMSSEEVNPNSFCIINELLYFGAGGRGVDIFDGMNFINISWKQGLTSENIFCIKEKNGRIYFGTENGLFVTK